MHDRQADLILSFCSSGSSTFQSSNPSPGRSKSKPAFFCLEQQILLRLEFRAHDPEHLPGGRRVRLDRQFGCVIEGALIDPYFSFCIGADEPSSNHRHSRSARHQMPYAGAAAWMCSHGAGVAKTMHAVCRHDQRAGIDGQTLARPSTSACRRAPSALPHRVRMWCAGARPNFSKMHSIAPCG